MRVMSATESAGKTCVVARHSGTVAYIGRTVEAARRYTLVYKRQHCIDYVFIMYQKYRLHISGA